MNAYSESYLAEAQDWLAEFLETSVYVLNKELNEAWMTFILSRYSIRLESGDPFTICGKSGSEVAFIIFGEERRELPFIYDRPPEYWLGWALAYYQWYRNIPFHFITNHIDIETILLMYKKYHEIDIAHFCDEMDRLISTHKKETSLKRLRMSRGLSQKDLSNITSIPIRTIQQYEQRQKNINKAQANYIFLLAQALSCSPKDLLEY
ncbi:MAG: helix-turn-helix transcriptional regulator [Bacilli bacterium]|nr:helix-turn-helix transcriptional regulator [Bacilli bacterium]